MHYPTQALKECLDEIDLGTQYHLSRYAFLCESIVHQEAQILQPKDDKRACLDRSSLLFRFR